MVKTIVWDIDDVLNDLMRAWFEKCWLPDHPACGLRYRDLTRNPPDQLLGIDRQTYLASLDRFRLSDDAADMLPDKAVLAWFQMNGFRFRHAALTARPVHTVSAAFAWTMRYFGSWFQSFAFVPAEREGQVHYGVDTSKADYLGWLGHKADYFIDDDPRNVSAAAQLGMHSFLVSRPWNSGGRELVAILHSIQNCL